MPWIATSGLRRHVDGLAIGESHICLALVAARTRAIAERPGLAFQVDQVHRLHFDAEQALDRGLDVGLGRRLPDLEDILVAFLHARTLLGAVRRAQDTEEMLFQLFHASHSSMRLSDSTVMTTLSAPTRLTGSSAAASTTCT